MSKKRDPEGRSRHIRPFLFENGDKVVFKGMRYPCVYRIVRRRHVLTDSRLSVGLKYSFNVYALKDASGNSIRDGVREVLIERTVSDEFASRIARSLGHHKPCVLAAL